MVKGRNRNKGVLTCLNKFYIIKFRSLTIKIHYRIFLAYGEELVLLLCLVVYNTFLLSVTSSGVMVPVLLVPMLSGGFWFANISVDYMDAIFIEIK